MFLCADFVVCVRDECLRFALRPVLRTQSRSGRIPTELHHSVQGWPRPWPTLGQPSQNHFQPQQKPLQKNVLAERSSRPGAIVVRSALIVRI